MCVHKSRRGFVYKIPYRRLRAWPLGRVRTRAKESCIQGAGGLDNHKLEGFIIMAIEIYLYIFLIQPLLPIKRVILVENSNKKSQKNFLQEKINLNFKINN